MTAFSTLQQRLPALFRSFKRAATAFLSIVLTCRVSVIGAALPFLIIVFTDQGRDILRRVAEGGPASKQAVLLDLAALAWAHSVFYLARIQLSLREGPHAQHVEAVEGRVRPKHNDEPQGQPAVL
jgi:hypothetical protein